MKSAASITSTLIIRPGTMESFLGDSRSMDFLLGQPQKTGGSCGQNAVMNLQATFGRWSSTRRDQYRVLGSSSLIRCAIMFTYSGIQALYTTKLHLLNLRMSKLGVLE